MKINEVEKLAGITKKNIRFYEEQGLLTPRRNSENGYRDYGDEDVLVLRRIRFLRKLGVPIEEIRLMLTGIHTVGDGMRRHLITMERERRNIDLSISFCEKLQNMNIPISEMDVDVLLSGMEQLERNGTVFKNKQVEDYRIRYVAPVLITVTTVVIVTAIIGLMIWAWRSDPRNAPPIWFFFLLIAAFAAIGVGTVAALIQRIGEIRNGEVDDAKKY